MKRLLAIISVLTFSLSLLASCSKSSVQGAANFNTNAVISVVSREDGSGTRGAFIELFGIEVKEDKVKKDMTTKEADIVNKTDVMLASISSNPYAIGYVSIGPPVMEKLNITKHPKALCKQIHRDVLILSQVID